jgi:hypothetical protein
LTTHRLLEAVHLVVVCPRCKGATGVREDQKSATCPRCGRPFNAQRARVYHRTADPRELARLIAEKNARLDKGFKRYEADVEASERRRQRAGKPLTPLETVTSRVSLTRGRKAQMELAVDLLCRRPQGGFHAEELMMTLVAVGWDEASVEGALEGMVRTGLLVEPVEDLFKKP